MLIIFIINESKLISDLIYLQIFISWILVSCNLSASRTHIPFIRNRSMAHCLLDTILAIIKLALPGKTSILCFKSDSRNRAFFVFSFSLFGLTSNLTWNEFIMTSVDLIFFKYKILWIPCWEYLSSSGQAVDLPIIYFRMTVYTYWSPERFFLLPNICCHNDRLLYELVEVIWE